MNERTVLMARSLSSGGSKVNATIARMPLTPQPVTVLAAPPQNDTYSQAVRLGDLIYLSGQLGIPLGGALPGSFSAEARQAFENVATVLRAAGSSLSLVAKVNIYITDFSRL